MNNESIPHRKNQINQESLKKLQIIGIRVLDSYSTLQHNQKKRIRLCGWIWTPKWLPKLRTKWRPSRPGSWTAGPPAAKTSIPSTGTNWGLLGNFSNTENRDKILETSAWSTEHGSFAYWNNSIGLSGYLRDLKTASVAKSDPSVLNLPLVSSSPQVYFLSGRGASPPSRARSLPWPSAAPVSRGGWRGSVSRTSPRRRRRRRGRRWGWPIYLEIISFSDKRS